MFPRCTETNLGFSMNVTMFYTTLLLSDWHLLSCGAAHGWPPHRHYCECITSQVFYIAMSCMLLCYLDAMYI